MNKTLTRAVFVTAFAASTVFAVQGSLGSKDSTFQSLCSGPGCAARDSAKENLDNGDSNAKENVSKEGGDTKDNLNKGDDAKDNLNKGSEAKDNLDKTNSDAKDNLDKDTSNAKDNLGVGLL